MEATIVLASYVGFYPKNLNPKSLIRIPTKSSIILKSLKEASLRTLTGT